MNPLSPLSSTRAARSSRPVLAGTVAAVLLLTGCGAAESGAGAPGTDTAVAGVVPVVATTNVYAAIAQAIGGDRVQATAVLDDPSADPHSFEATPQDQVTIAQAKLVIANGGGYDDFTGRMVDAADPKPVLLDAVELSGLEEDADHAEESPAEESGSAPAEEEHAHDHGAFNEHVFYSPEAMQKLATAIAAELGELDPAGADTFAANAKTFDAGLAAIEQRAADLKAAHPGLQAVVTEPVANYLLSEVGVTDVTPEGFAEAVEAETDPAPRDVADVDALITGKQIQLLVFNEQTSGPVTDQVRAQAEQAGITVLPVSETLPEGTTDYLAWINGTLDTLETDLGQSAG